MHFFFSLKTKGSVKEMASRCDCRMVAGCLITAVCMLSLQQVAASSRLLELALGVRLAAAALDEFRLLVVNAPSNDNAEAFVHFVARHCPTDIVLNATLLGFEKFERPLRLAGCSSAIHSLGSYKLCVSTGRQASKGPATVGEEVTCGAHECRSWCHAKSALVAPVTHILSE